MQAEMERAEGEQASALSLLRKTRKKQIAQIEAKEKAAHEAKVRAAKANAKPDDGWVSQARLRANRLLIDC